MRRLFITIAATSAVAAGLAIAGDQFPYDLDKDGTVDREEWVHGGDKGVMFDNYDAIDRDEFRDATFRAYDMDGDGSWSQTEAGVFKDAELRSGSEISQ